MADIFLSYSSIDAQRVEVLREALGAHGFSFVWDFNVPPGVDWDTWIRQRLTESRCAVVVWTYHAIQTPSVRHEAIIAQNQNKLISVLLDAVPARDFPMDLNVVDAVNLSAWSGDTQAKEYADLVHRLEAALKGAANQPRLFSSSKSHDLPATEKLRLIFICYRREDSQDATGRLYDRLLDAYGPESVFMDIDSVPLGIDFVQHVTERISECKAVIVVIGKQWLKVTDKRGQRRLDNDDDLVRAEVAAALQQEVPVIPVLVQDAEIPAAEELPENIRPLARRHGMSLSAVRWRSDVNRLLKELDRVMKV